MPTFTTANIRNTVLLSHSGAGKTMLAEAILFSASMLSRLGSIEEGTTTSDYEPEEIRRQSSVQSSIIPCLWNQNKINILDTPGYADFRGDVISSLNVADSAIILISASAGIEVGTLQLWKMVQERKIPCTLFISKMDRENSDHKRIINEITSQLGRNCVPYNIPIGKESDLSGVYNILNNDSDSLPDEIKSDASQFSEQLLELIAETDDELVNKYLDGIALTSEEISQGLKNGVHSNSIVPILFGSSTINIGIQELLDFISSNLPSPDENIPIMAENSSSGNRVQLNYDPEGDLSAIVFKTTADPFVGKLSYFKVLNGTLSSDSEVWNVSKETTEKIAQTFTVRGKDQEPIDSVVAGDIGAVSKLNTVLTNDYISGENNPLELTPIRFPQPIYQMAVSPKSRADVDKMTSSLSRIGEEDPTLKIEREQSTGETLLNGLGDTHLEVSIERMKRKFGVEMTLSLPKVPYKETITANSKAEYRHKKQSGGHGQFGHVWLELEPKDRGDGFEFADKIVGGAVPKEYIPSVEKGVSKILDEGVLAGFPIVDIKVTLFDGSFHPVDSSGVCFEIAGSQAFSSGMMGATPALLEPIVQAEITVPDSFTGDIIGDLNSKRGRIQGMNPLGEGITTVEAEVPQAEMLRYATELRSMTQGQGEFKTAFGHYEMVPHHLIDEIVENLKKQSENTIEE